MKRRPCSKLGSLKLDVCDDLMHELKLSEQLENERPNTNELKRDNVSRKLSSVYVSRKYTHIYKLAHKYYNSTSRTNSGTCNARRMGCTARTRKMPPILCL